MSDQSSDQFSSQAGGAGMGGTGAGTGAGGVASSLMSQARDAAGGAYEEARSRAGDIASRTAQAARAEALSRAEGAKDGLAEQGERLAQSLRGALGGDEGSIQSRLMAAAADSVQELAGSLRGKSLEQLLSDTSGFARRNPGAFVAAAALTGFAVARFVRASAPTSQSQADIEGAGLGSAYGSPRQTGEGYAGQGDDLGRSAGGMGQGSQGYGSSSFGGTGYGASSGTEGIGGRSGVSTSGLSTRDAGDDADDLGSRGGSLP